MRILLLYAAAADNETLSYQREWPWQFQAHPRFDCIAVNVASRSVTARVRRRLREVSWPRSGFDGVVVLHSVFSNSLALLPKEVEALARIPVPKAYFAGNEYKLVPEKLRFAEDAGIKLLVTENMDPRVHALYRERLGCEAIGIPKGIDPSVFSPRRPRRERPLDLGYRGFDAPWYIGHDERQELLRAFGPATAARGLHTDFSLDPAKRFDTAGWAAFLSSCKGQIGTEAGGSRFELDDATRLAVLAFQAGHPHATWDDVRERFFVEPWTGPTSRVLSGRIVEAAASGTTQILLEGEYGGYFRPGVHYIPVRKDLTDVDEALDRFLDEAYADEIAANALELAHGELTYEKLIDRFAAAFEPLVR